MGSFYGRTCISFSAGSQNRARRRAGAKQQALLERSKTDRYSRPLLEIPLQSLQVIRTEVTKRSRLAAGGEGTGAQPTAVATESAQGGDTAVVGQLVCIERGQLPVCVQVAACQKEPAYRVYQS